MLNGIAPVFLIYFPKAKGIWKFPIPIYLDEKLTGVYVDQNNEQLEVSTESVADISDKKTVKVIQKGDKQTATVELIANKGSIGLNILLPLLKTLYDYTLKDKDYKIAYFNNNILIFNAKLARAAKVEGRTNDLIAITIELEVKTENKEDDKVTQLEAGKTGNITTAYDASPARTFTVETTTSNAAGTLTKQTPVTMSTNSKYLAPVPRKLD